jgi:hypothetical protein
MRMAGHTGTTKAHIGTLTKVCTGRCSSERPIQWFTRKASNADGFEAHCIECRAHERRQREYDITPEQYLRMLFSQDFKCAICRTAQDELEHGLVCDHSHSTNRMRMLLCNWCNSLLGFAKDDVNRLRKSAEYLELWSEDE